MTEPETKPTFMNRIRNFSVRELDAFSYTEPAATVTSIIGGRLSIFAYILLCWGIYEAIFGLIRGEFDTSYNSNKVGPNEGKTLRLPKEIAVAIKDSFAPMLDAAYVTVEAEARVIHESDTNDAKPREKFPLVVRDCQIGKGEFITPVQGKCITFSDEHWGVKGSYDEDIYKYIQISVSACQDSAEDIAANTRKCATANQIREMFFDANARVNVALWVREQNDFDSWQWKSRSYTTVSEKWVGVETYFRNVELQRYGTLSLSTGRTSWREVAELSDRESPIEIDEYGQYGMFLRYYLRADDEDVTIVRTKYGFVQAMELIGSAWSCLTLTIGAIGCYLNSKIYQMAKEQSERNQIEVDENRKSEEIQKYKNFQSQILDIVDKKQKERENVIKSPVRRQLSLIRRQASGDVDRKIRDFENRNKLNERIEFLSDMLCDVHAELLRSKPNFKFKDSLELHEDEQQKDSCSARQIRVDSAEL